MKSFITLKSLNLKIKEGDFVSIIGEVGAGKSSLISALIGDLVFIDSETLDEY